MEGIDRTKVSRVEEVLNALKRHTPLEPDPYVTFEYIIAGCFPSVWKNIQQKLSDEHMAGYIEGVEAAKNLTKEE